ncbi:D-arabinono-1,4-lactone oxidase [Arachnomyces sp. PD_36]|nr:D-arabinono-1,4-lactone oxidase [Arachnomyces sp. PD_36]
MDPLIISELSKLDPTIPFRATTSHTHHTWAKTFYSRPELYIQPHSVDEIQKIVTLARRCRRRLVTVGSAHSPSDLTCTSAWTLNLDNFNRVLDIDRETGIVTVESGIRLRELRKELENNGLMLRNLGSIDDQSVAGAISTGTHGSSVRHGLLSESIVSMSLMLSNGRVVRCSETVNVSLFKAALVSLGALGVITEITLRAVPAFKVAWHQSLWSLGDVLEEWDSDLWTSSEFVRVWWLPYLKRAIVWRADKTSLPIKTPPTDFFGGSLGYHVYHNLLYLANYIPKILPWVEWFVFGMQYGFKPGNRVTEAVEPGHQALLLNCLYSQFVNEWALPLEKGPEAIGRLSAWLHGDMETARIPFSSKGLWVHCPVEVRVSDTSLTKSPRPFLDPTCPTGPTLFLNATLYRPYHRDPPCTERYYQAFEWLMRDMGARPHWAKNFTQDTGRSELHEMYGSDMEEWLRVRDESDVDGMFVGEWHRRNLLPDPTPSEARDGEISVLPLEEREKARKLFRQAGSGDGVEWIGNRDWLTSSSSAKTTLPAVRTGNAASEKGWTNLSDSSPPMTASSEESFDRLAHGEASTVLPERVVGT